MVIKYIKAWFFYSVALVFAGIGAGMLVGGIAGGIMGAQGVDLESTTFQFVIFGLSFVVQLVVSFFVYRWSIQKYIFPQLPQAIPAEYYPQAQPYDTGDQYAGLPQSDDPYDQPIQEESDGRWRPPQA